MSETVGVSTVGVGEQEVGGGETLPRLLHPAALHPPLAPHLDLPTTGRVILGAVSRTTGGHRLSLCC